MICDERERGGSGVKRRDSGGPLEHDRPVEPEAEQDDAVKEEVLLESMDEELRDFLAADALDVRADPGFKERLRRELWDLVERNAIKWRESMGSSRDSDDPDDR